jgi:hypothetical protein
MAKGTPRLVLTRSVVLSATAHRAWQTRLIAQAQRTQVIDPLAFVAALKPMGKPCANGFF